MSSTSGQAELLALVDVDDAGQCHGQQRGGPRPAGTEGDVDGAPKVRSR